MKQWLTLALAVCTTPLGWTQELGRVIASTPIVQQVTVPRQVCTTEQVSVQPPRSQAGSVLGALAGGAIGNAAAQRSDRTAATILGAVGGAVIGQRLEDNPPARLHNVERCTTQNFYENKTVAFNVIYEYAGKQYTVQTPTDPGPTIALQISPVGSSTALPAAQSVQAPIIATPAPAPQMAPTYIEVPVVQRGYYVQPYQLYYPPAIFPLTAPHHWRHRHWR